MDHDNLPLMTVISMAVPIVAVVMGISMVMMKVWLNHQRRSEALKLYHAERMAAIEKGIELPPAMVEETPGRSEPGWVRHRRNGLILLLVGLAVSGAMWGTGNAAYLWGLVPAAIGAAFLLASLLEAREQGTPGGILQHVAERTSPRDCSH